MNKYFVEAYKESFGHFPSPNAVLRLFVGEDELVKFFNAAVNLCKDVTLDPMTYDETECGFDVACDIGMAIDNLRVKGD
jgi:hypothetical protein